MKHLIFYGASDDLFEMAGDLSDEICDASGAPMEFTIYGSDGSGLKVIAYYTDGGTWAIGIAALDEDTIIPDWMMKWGTADNGYSVQLNIVVPDDVTVKPSK